MRAVGSLCVSPGFYFFHQISTPNLYQLCKKSNSKKCVAKRILKTDRKKHSERKNYQRGCRKLWSPYLIQMHYGIASTHHQHQQYHHHHEHHHLQLHHAGSSRKGKGVIWSYWSPLSDQGLQLPQTHPPFIMRLIKMCQGGLWRQTSGRGKRILVMTATWNADTSLSRSPVTIFISLEPRKKTN